MENVVIMTVPTTESARSIFTELNRCDGEDGFRLEAGAHLFRDAHGRVAQVEDVTNIVPVATAAGTAIGAVIGVVSGPLALLFGGAAGALVGSVVDAVSAEDTEDVLQGVLRAVPPSTHAVVTVVHERSPEVVDGIAVRHQAALLRRPRADVESDLAAAEEAVIAAREAAHRVLATHRRVAAEKSLFDRLGNLKDKVLDRG